MSKPNLIVAVDQVALLRASRNGREPDPVHFALQAELAGAAGIRAHLRMNQRPITEEDVNLLNRLVKTQFYLQASPHQDILHIVNALRPHNLILVAERRDERAIDSGLDAVLLANELKGILHNIDASQTRTFLFVEPELDQVKIAAKLNANGILLNTRDLMHDPASDTGKKRLDRVRDAARLANKLNLKTHLAGGVKIEGLASLAAIQGIAAVHVGHPLIARALLTGVPMAVRTFIDHL